MVKCRKKRVSIDQPYVITMYNANMGGVDRMDQNVSTYRISIRSKKWWWPLFAYLLNVAMQNSWLVYRLTEGAKRQPLDQLDFRRDICNLYYKRYAMERSTVGRMPGRPKPMDKRVPVTPNWQCRPLSTTESDPETVFCMWTKGAQEVPKMWCRTAHELLRLVSPVLTLQVTDMWK